MRPGPTHSLTSKRRTMFPWEAAENRDANRIARPAYDGGLKDQVMENRAKKNNEKAARIASDKADDARIECERAAFAAEAQAEIKAQRDREAVVAQREAAAMERYNQAAQPTREQQIAAFQQRREAHVDAEAHKTFGARVHVQTEHTGITDRPSSRVHAPPGGASSFSLAHHDGSSMAPRAAPPPRAPNVAQPSAAAQARPDVANDQMAAAIRARAQGSSIFG
uniref:Uncharacterized protein n=1 Tax=Prymnesium polylepis TaxID=72548 RepID=A0A7S4M246_9EUKA